MDGVEPDYKNNREAEIAFLKTNTKLRNAARPKYAVKIKDNPTGNPRRRMLPNRASARPPYRLSETSAACGESRSAACRRLQQRRS